LVGGVMFLVCVGRVVWCWVVFWGLCFLGLVLWGVEVGGLELFWGLSLFFLVAYFSFVWLLVVLMVEDELRFEEVLGEIRARMLSVPCPECGWVPRRVVREGEVVVCGGCGLPYTVEKCLSDMGRHVIRRIVESVLSRFRVHVSGEVRESFAVFEEYAGAVLGELRRLFEAQGSLPSLEELDCVMEAHTERVLGGIAQATEMLMGDHREIKLGVERVFGKLTSLSVKIHNIVAFFERLARVPQDYWRTVEAPPRRVLVSLVYRDFEGGERSVNLSENELAEGVILGREMNGFGLIVKLGGETRKLGLSDLTVSRSHARIWCENGQILIQDLRSKNKTYVNGVELQPERKETLRDGDTVRLGLGTTFKIKM